jgi:hypothetical protein
MTSQLTPRSFRALGLALCLLATGCGPGSLSGKVSYEGAPLRGGTVTFMTEDGKARTGGVIQPDGTYSADNVPVGAVLVGVETESARDQPAGSSPESRYVPIPRHLRNPRESGVRLIVRGGAQTENLELK